MKNVSLDSVNAVYDCARLAKFDVHQVDDAKFQEFCLLLREFERSLGESARDDYWRPFLRLLKRYRFDVSSTPLHFDYPQGHSPGLVEQLKRKLMHCDLIYPQFTDAAREMVDVLLTLVDSHSNPIVTVCAAIAGSGGGDVAMLIKEPRLIPAVESRLSEEPEFGAVEVVSPAQLKGHYCYSTLMVIGPARWYDEYVLQSPRAHYIHIVKYRWMNDSKPSTGVFAGSPTNSVGVWMGDSTFASGGTKESSNSSSNSLDAEDFMPSLDWDDILRLMSPRVAGDFDREDEEYVTARLFQLEGEQVVPLDSSDGARATVLLFDQESEDPVHRISVADIEAGMFLLVRTEGGGEYIPLVADRILRWSSTKAREVQRDWKDRLRRKVRQDGYDQVVVDLKSFGSKRANYANLRNWMSYRTIKTEDQRDFRAIMRLIGLGVNFNNYWKMMTLILSAHRRAGQLIRKQLLAQVRNADLRDLEKLGRMDFELPGVEGGNLTAVRIQSIHPQTYEIEIAKLGRPIDVDGNIWLG